MRDLGSVRNKCGGIGDDKQQNLMEIHQGELGAADRRRGKAIAMLFEMQDRRRRAAVPDAEIVGAGDG